MHSRFDGVHQIGNHDLFKGAKMFKTRRLQRKPVERGRALIGGRLAGTGDPAQLFSFDTGQAVTLKRGLHIRLDARQENVKTGLLSIDAVDQSLAHVIAEMPSVKPIAPNARSCPASSLPCIRLYSATNRLAICGSSMLSLS